MARLPVVSSDNNTWGSVLNTFLQVGHNAGGTLIGTQSVYNVKDDTYGANGDGVHDDTTAIQAAITAASTSAGIVYLPPGIYKISSALTFPQGTAKGTSLIGAGPGISVIKPATGAQYNAVQTAFPVSSGTSGYTYSHLRFEDFTIDCSNVTGTTAHLGNGLFLFGGIECLIRRVYVLNSPNWGIVLDASAVNDCYWSWVEDCFIDGCAGGIDADYNTACTLTGNVIPNITGTSAASQGLFSGNPGTNTYSIYSASQQTRIINNVLGTSASTNAALWTANIENIIMGNYFITTGGPCLHNAANTNTIMGNVFEGPCQHTAAPAIIPGTDDVYVGNTFITGGTPLFTYCLENSTSGVVVIGNHLLAGASGVLHPQSSAIWHISGNGGYNPIGQVTAPGFPATTVAATNTTGVDVTAFVANGTAAITVVQIAGASGSYVTTGYQIAANGWGSVRIPSGGSVKFTYASGAPTWTWFGD